MNKRLTGVIGISLFLLFIGGTVLLPSFHRAHHAHKHAPREATACPICQFVNAPVIATTSALAPMAGLVDAGHAVIRVSTVPVSSPRDPTQARAPPSA